MVWIGCISIPRASSLDKLGMRKLSMRIDLFGHLPINSKYRPCPLLVKYVEAGWLGKKAGRGFYDYRGAKPVPTR